jgi:YaiO family outer membrane protein
LYLSGQHALALPHYETFNAATKDAAVAELIKNVKAELLERARALDAAQRYKEAAAAYREYLAARPDDDDARGAWARTLALQGLLPQAVALYQEILARHPSDIGVLVGIGKIFIWQKNPGSARSYYEEALRIDPGNLEARRGMADVLYWSGKDKGALRAYEAIFSSTQDPEAGQRVRELRGEQLGSPRAPIGKPQLLPTLPFRDYIKAAYSHYTYTQGIADERDYLLEASTSFGNHTLVGRLERLHRFSFEDIPFSAELYSPLWDKAWGSLSVLATASPNFAPNYLLGGEIVQGLGVLHSSLASLEVSASYKRLAYGYKARTPPTFSIPSQEIDVLSPSLTYYLPYNLWLTEKLLYIPQTGSITLSSRLTWRPTDRLEAYASGAFGTTGERIIAFQDFTRAESRSYQGGVIFPITESFSGEISAFYEDRGFLYIRRGGSFNLIWHF